MDSDEVWRLARERNTRLKLNAIARARQYAVLLMDLWKHDEKAPRQFKDYQECENEQVYYAQARDLRPPRGKNVRLLQAMGVTNRASLNMYRRILEIPLDVWQRADDENWSLRQVLAAVSEADLYAADEPNKTLTAPVVYLMFDPIRDLYKIGMTRKEVQKRLKAIRQQSNRAVEVIHTITCEDAATAYDVEQRLHRYFGAERWIREWFKLTDKDIEWLLQINHTADVPSDWDIFMRAFSHFEAACIEVCQSGDKQTREAMLQMIKELVADLSESEQVESQV